ncbi:hypothetical protein ASA1KI_08010 [Opitutales bacterium ASA1]|uniref:serine hydrolase domain-containing protein n=1 Tax=Congregicoccus parvus TaxID=3081749 RepID=UPI002B30952B|nr:hypothetical protein ASA1KI_08010 [Opitutales bacterium ASA1]
MIKPTLFLAGFLGATLPVSPAVAAESEELAALLQTLVDESGLPSIAAAAVRADSDLGAAAVGVRKKGDTTPVTIDDKYHLGSCTKPMTATLAAILVEEGTLQWTSTVGDVLGETISDIHPGYRDVTLEQLLAHVGGLPADPPTRAWRQAWKDQGTLAPRAQRLAFCAALLAAKPAQRPGSAAVYSNQGYAVAGAMLETAADEPWETLLVRKVFTPLGMTSAGFRAPGSPDALDQPWGHTGEKPVAPGPQADNPDAIGPAGTVHASIGDWAKFARYHLRRQPAPLLHEASSLDRLHGTLAASAPHAVGGWLAHDIPALGGRAIQMTGSNTMWFSLLWILPSKDLAVVVTTNSGVREAFPTLDRVAAALIRSHGR